MKHLVLGGGGFIGYHLVERLLKNDKVRVFDSNLDKYSNSDWEEIELVTGNFLDCDYVSLLDGIDIVWHLISSTVASEGTSSLAAEFMDNVLPTLKLMEAMVKQNIPKIIFISSGGTVYGETTETVNEEFSLNPICSYGLQKMTIEKCLSLYRRYHNIQAIVARLSNPYGARQDLKRKQGVIPIFINRIMNGEPLEIWGDGNAIRDYIYIEDAISALLCLVDYSGPYTTFNIASGETISLNNLIDLLKEKLGIPPTVYYRPRRLCDVASNSFDTSRIRKELNWKAETSLQEGIEKMIDLHKH